MRTAGQRLNSSLSGLVSLSLLLDILRGTSPIGSLNTVLNGQTGCDVKFHGIQAIYILRGDNDKLLLKGLNAIGKLLKTSYNHNPN